MALAKPRELLGHPYSPLCHNVTGNGRREGLKNSGIGQSAAKPPGDRLKVQRLGKLALDKGEIPTSAGQCFSCKYMPMVIKYSPKKGGYIMVYTKNKFQISKECLAEAYNQLGSAQKVADKFGVSKKLILNHMKELNIKRADTNKNKGKKQAKRIQFFSGQGLNGVEIAKKLKITPSTVYRIAARHNVKIVDNFHKGFSVSANGYKLIKVDDHPFADSKGYVREHRLVMEGFLDRFLEPEECVHHIDGDKLNNSIENLELMLIEGHVKLHHTGKQGRGPDKKPRKKH